MKRVAVLGSSGQIGTYLVQFLREKNYNVHGYDIDPSATTDHVVDLRCDKLNFTGYDFVYFLAFDVGGSRYLKTYQHTSDFIHNNLALMTNVFGELKNTETPFMFTSSQMANMSYSPYGLLKHTGELLTKALSGLTVKFWNVYGIENDLEKSHVITDFILKAKAGKIDMMTDGTECRQFLYAEDCCQCIEMLSNKYDSIDRNQELHITNFEWHSVLEVATIIGSHFPECVIEPAKSKDTVQQDKRNEPDNYILDYWKPRTVLPVGIKKIIGAMNL